MAAELVIAPEAELDLADSYGWYESREPELCRSVHVGYRRALVRRFPYAVFYEHAEGAVTIYAVFHASRAPDKWRQRLP